MDARKPTPKPNPTSATKPAARATAPRPAAAPGKVPPSGKKSAQPTSFMNWLGRQVGHVTSAVKTEAPKPPHGKPAAVAKPAPGKSSAGPGTGKAAPKSPAAATSRPASAAAPAGGVVVYREDKVEEAEMPDRPGVILRRTIIDEVVVEAPPASPQPRPAPDSGPGDRRP